MKHTQIISIKMYVNKVNKTKKRQYIKTKLFPEDPEKGSSSENYLL